MDFRNESTEDKIINASFRVFEKHGLSGTTTRKIAEEAGVSEVTIFRKFKSKKRLLNQAKESYTQYLLKKLDEIFAYDEDVSVEDYLRISFRNLVNLSENELGIIKVGLEEIRATPFEDNSLSKIADKIISKLSGFFKLKMEMGEIRKINSEILALNVFSIIFESIILWKVYGKDPANDVSQYSDDFLDILFNGISLNGSC